MADLPNFITFEGIDGSGKSSMAKQAKNWLEDAGHTVFLTMEPSSSWIGDAVRRSISEDVAPFTEMLLFLADRAHHTMLMNEKIEEGQIVLCDRYSHSTFAYQTVELTRFMPRDELIQWMMLSSKPFVMEPDIIFLFDAVPEISMGRISDRDEFAKFEYVGFLEKVRENYLHISHLNGNFIRIDANRTKNEVEEILKMRLSETGLL